MKWPLRFCCGGLWPLTRTLTARCAFRGFAIVQTLSERPGKTKAHGRSIGSRNGSSKTSSSGGLSEVGALRGVAGLRTSNSPKSRHVAELWGFYVAPEARRSGLAAALLEALIHTAEEKFEAIRATVVASNDAAFRLYDKAGFRTFGCQPRALKVSGRSYDELLMRLPLRSSDE